MLGLLLSTLAVAAPLTEAPQTVLPGHSYGGCPRATGVPGEIALESRDGVRFLEATRDGYRPRGQLTIADLGCPEAAARANGAAIVGGVHRGSGLDDADAIVAAVRDPGGAWGEPVSFELPEYAIVDDVRMSVADSGDAVVAWNEETDDVWRLRMARRAAGQPFGPAETVGPVPGQDAMVVAGVAATGETIVLTAAVESARVPLRVPVRVTIARRGEPLPAFRELGLVPWRSTPALAVAQDGRAVVALPDGAWMRVAERAPGAAFGEPAVVGAAADPVAVGASAALGDDGTAAIAWKGEEEHATALVTRRGLGAFTAPVSVRPRTPSTEDPFFLSQTFEANVGIVPAFHDVGTSLTLTGDGHAALADYRDDDVHGVYQLRAALTTVPLGGDRAETQVLGGVLGLTARAVPVSLADGTPALAWSERIDESGTLHLAAQGATPPREPPPPRVRVGAPARSLLVPGKPLVLPVRCRAACDVRGQALGGSRATGRLRLTRAGRGLLKLETGSVPVAPRRLGPVRIRITYGPPNTQRPRARIVTVRLRRPADPPAWQIAGLRADEAGGAIRVTWRVRHAPKTALYLIAGSATRAWSGEPLAFASALTTEGRRSFTVTLKAHADIHWVSVYYNRGEPPVVVPVTAPGAAAGAVSAAPR
jgi:hypothetical protein